MCTPPLSLGKIKSEYKSLSRVSVPDVIQMKQAKGVLLYDSCL